jgi:hypothetical protein
VVGRADRLITVHFRVDGLGRAQHRVRIGEGLRKIVDEGEVRVADADDLAGLELVVVLNALAIDERAVAAIEVAQRPVAGGLKNFCVVAAATLVLDDNRIRRRPAHGYGFAIDETKNVCPLRAFANNQVGGHRIGIKAHVDPVVEYFARAGRNAGLGGGVGEKTNCSWPV